MKAHATIGLAQSDYLICKRSQKRVEAHCCDEMRTRVAWVCDLHTDPFNCPDCLIHYSPRFREYGLIVHDGGTSLIAIGFCPWCSMRLPHSLRHRWFAELRMLGIDPAEHKVPAKYQSAAWWAESGPDAGPEE